MGRWPLRVHSGWWSLPQSRSLEGMTSQVPQLSRPTRVLGLQTHLHDALPHSLLSRFPLRQGAQSTFINLLLCGRQRRDASLTPLANFTILPNTTFLPQCSQPLTVTNTDNCEMEEEDGTGQSLKAVLKIDVGDEDKKKTKRKGSHIFFQQLYICFRTEF